MDTDEYFEALRKDFERTNLVATKARELDTTPSGSLR